MFIMNQMRGVTLNMVEFEYVNGQEKRVEKKYDQLMKDIEHLEREGDIDRVKEKYEMLLDKKKIGDIDWMDELLISVYRDVIKHDLNKI